MSEPVRLCPRCNTIRPFDENFCTGSFNQLPCGYRLLEVRIQTREEVEAQKVPAPEKPGQVSVATTASKSTTCCNGHPLGEGDYLCLVCGEGPKQENKPIAASPAQKRVLGSWQIESELEVASGEADLYLVTRVEAGANGSTAVLKYFRRGIDPQTDLYPALRKIDPDASAQLLDVGRFENRAFEVWEYIPFGSLGQLPIEKKTSPQFIREAVKEIGKAIAGLAAVGVRHRDLKPANILVRRLEPLDLVLADFGTAVLGEFDLMLTVVRQTTRYTAPEAIIGAYSASSDWWSLGVIILELLTGGKTFEGVHEKAFLLHLITRGIEVPAELPDEWRELLMGLLTRDHCTRWQWSQVERWLKGEKGIPHSYIAEPEDVAAGRTIRLGNRDFKSAKRFSIDAAEAQNWDQAVDLLQRGMLATWLEELSVSQSIMSEVRRITADSSLDWDARLSLCLLLLNEDIPLCRRGQVIDPHWILNNPSIALSWIGGSIPRHLKRLDRVGWLVRLRERVDRIRARVQEYKIPVNQTELDGLSLVTLASTLEKRWAERRKLYPEAIESAVAALYERKMLSEEDLILLLAVRTDVLRPADDILREAGELARQAGVQDFVPESAKVWFDSSRADIFDQLNTRVGNFCQCGRDLADQWADGFRLERRLSLAKTLVLLSIPANEFRPPRQQEYVKNVLNFFERKLVSSVQRGPLVRLLISRHSRNMDLNEIGSKTVTADSLLNAILKRVSGWQPIDPSVFHNDPAKERRIRNLKEVALNYRRETGIDALYLGFPFVVLRQSVEATVRIAPVYLWPVKLNVPTGQRAVAQVGFDKEREEVRLNPALHFLLRSDLTQALEEIRQELLTRTGLDLTDVIDSIAKLEKVSSRNLTKVPPPSIGVAFGETRFECAAAIFLCDFSGQTIAQDLKTLANRGIARTSLEVMIRALVPPIELASRAVPEKERCFTAEADPSQKRAVFQARVPPGLVVQGPPGTGKSQTIVNTVCDSLGRNERVLVVCQKPAALEVVQKRLVAEGLSNRFFYLKDPIGDRAPTLKGLREQLDRLGQRELVSFNAVESNRALLADRVEALETQLNSHHEALHGIDPGCGLPYKEILCQLLELEKCVTPPIAAPRLRMELIDCSVSAIELVCDQIEPEARDWLNSGWEQSALHALKEFFPDSDLIHSFWKDFDQFCDAERNRVAALNEAERFVQTDAAQPLQNWIASHGATLSALDQRLCESISSWSPLFRTLGARQGEDLLSQIQALQNRIAHLDTIHGHVNWSELLLNSERKLIERLSVCGHSAAQIPVGVVQKLSPKRLFHQYLVKRFCKKHGVPGSREEASRLALACNLELTMRPIRTEFQQIQKELGEKKDITHLIDLKRELELLHKDLSNVKRFVELLLTCPVNITEIDALLKSKQSLTYRSWLDECQRTIRFLEASYESLSRLDKLRVWFTEEWCKKTREEIEAGTNNTTRLQKISECRDSLESFQRFRMHVVGLAELTMKSLSVLREHQGSWRTLPAKALASEMQRTIRREALLGWKDRYERSHPAIRMSGEDFERKKTSLSEADAKLRQLNRSYLAQNLNGIVAPRRAWDEVTMLTGPRSKRLREVVDLGESLGLYTLRPVWLVNPDMVSRLFPLKPGFFDVVIFDEASQLPVESSLPALFRAKRVVVSGDEKQMPPSSFFQSRLQNDEEEEADTWRNDEDAHAHDVGADPRLAKQNRREVKDCEDLLELAQTVLPNVTLEVHYRSRYRQLIAFSNAAFYSEKLSVPAQHPDSEIRKIKPITVVRTDSVYSRQTNLGEADKVIEILGDLWKGMPFEKRPSVGVVTFNLKQAELITEKLEERAEADLGFRSELERENHRQHAGEDARLFVKNLENVQGDERDWIIFSTTFGRDTSGTFLRNFGVLIHEGGEKRLNVAITRAKEKVIIVTSMPVPEVSNFVNGHRSPNRPRDYLQAYLDYAEKVSSGNLSLAKTSLKSLRNIQDVTEPNLLQPSGGIALEIRALLEQRGLRLEPLNTPDAFGVDYAVIHPQSGGFCLGIECDSPRHGLLDEARGRELWRTQVLTSSLKRVYRVWTRSWYNDPKKEAQKLFEVVTDAVRNYP